jgi:hypothetical protein
VASTYVRVLLHAASQTLLPVVGHMPLYTAGQYMSCMQQPWQQCVPLGTVFFSTCGGAWRVDCNADGMRS